MILSTLFKMKPPYTITGKILKLVASISEPVLPQYMKHKEIPPII